MSFRAGGISRDEKEKLTDFPEGAGPAYPSILTQCQVIHPAQCPSQSSPGTREWTATAHGSEQRCHDKRGISRSKPLSSHHSWQTLSLQPSVIIKKSSQVNLVPMKDARLTAQEIPFPCLQISFSLPTSSQFLLSARKTHPLRSSGMVSSTNPSAAASFIK